MRSVDYFHPVDRAGRRVTRGDLEVEQWHEWKTDLSRILRCAAGFFYQHFVRGARRVVFDGVEPADRFSESIQFELFEYIYHHVLRKDDEWAAREWLRERYRANAQSVLQHRYDHRQIGCLYLYTTPQVMLDDLMIQPITQGDIFANANTIILMGRTRRRWPVRPGAVDTQAPRQRVRRRDPPLSNHRSGPGFLTVRIQS